MTSEEVMDLTFTGDAGSTGGSGGSGGPGGSGDSGGSGGGVVTGLIGVNACNTSCVSTPLVMGRWCKVLVVMLQSARSIGTGGDRATPPVIPHQKVGQAPKNLYGVSFRILVTDPSWIFAPMAPYTRDYLAKSFF